MTRDGLLLLLALLAAGCAPAGPARVKAPDLADEIPLGALPRQELAKGECGLFLWKVGPSPRLLLMAKADPPVARVVLGGRMLDLPRVEGAGPGQPVTIYAAGAVRIALDLAVEERRGLTGGAVIPSGSLRLERTGGETVVIPVSGLLACR